MNASFNVHFRFHYDASFEADEEVRLGLYTVIERMYPGIQARLKLDAQMDKFHNAVGMFGIDMAVITREKKQPGINSHLNNVCQCFFLALIWLSLFRTMVGELWR